MAKKTRKPDTLVTTLGRAALRRGTVGGQRGYLAIPVGFAVLRTVRKAVTKSQETVAIEKLKVGQSVTIVAVRAFSRRERKAAQR